MNHTKIRDTQQIMDQTSMDDFTKGVGDAGSRHVFGNTKRGRDIRFAFQNPNGVMECNIDNDDKRDGLHDSTHLANSVDHNIEVVGLVEKMLTGDT